MRKDLVEKRKDLYRLREDLCIFCVDLSVLREYFCDGFEARDRE